jgi:hypothetical protein
MSYNFLNKFLLKVLIRQMGNLLAEQLKFKNLNCCREILAYLMVI